MHEVLMTMGPLLAFGLVPVWIPIIGTAVGATFDRLRPQETTPAERAVQEAKRRSETLRAQIRTTTPTAEPLAA